jgi:hypothetical protein
MADHMGHSAGAQPYRRIWPLFFFLILAVVSMLLHMEKSHRQKEVLAAKQQFSAMVRARPVEKVKAQRGRFYKIQFYLGYPSTTSYAVADFIRRLGATIPPRQVRDLQINPALQNFSFRLTVGIAAGGSENAYLAAACYLEAMRKFPEIMQIALTKIDPLPGSGGVNRVHFFSIAGQAEIR